MTGETAQSICSKTNAGPACEGISRDVFFGLEAILIVNAIFNGDIEHGIAHISGLWGLGSSVKNVDSTGLSDAAYNFLLAKLEAGGASDLKRSLPDIEHLNTIRMIQASRLEHDEIEFMDVSSLNRQKRSIDSPDLTHRMMVRGAKLNDLSHDLAIDQLSNGESAISFNLNNTRLDGQSELKKRDSSQFGLKITFSFPGKLPDDRSLITDIAHGFAKHWGQTAFSQTGWSDYAAGLQDSDGNHIVKFRITLSDDKPSSDNADLP
jgi:hypothetical protein